ncbi:MAG: MFS transporter [Gammaproteobacteria bacterium]|jgi:MFS family permease|nr:MFS transporter [Gammaproteobacteria bacterium]MBT6584626.1 MFS transporter [Gammaproteobacteria bacterium]MBT6892557.1 MFS transporter [Gammaproteobacteria bacterium]MBT7880450.1 MFS transporter [Gammaproteobacteria bacterium]
MNTRDGNPSPHSPGTRPWGAFLYRDYRFLWITLIASSIVVWMRILVTAQWLLDETGSAYLVGLIGVVQLVVQVPVTLWAGTLADRVDRKRLMSFAHAATAMALLTLGILNWQDMLTPVLVYTGIAITAATHMLASPARSALLPIIIPERELMLAASTDTASSNAAAIAGPLIFAIVAVTANLTAVFILAGSISLISSLLPQFIRAKGVAAGHEHEEGEKPSQIRQTRDGFSFVSKHPILPGLFLLDAGITTASFYREILPVLALGLFAGGASATGFLGAANSAGAIFGSFIALMLVGFRAKGMLVLYASFAYGFFLFGFGTATTLWFGILMIALLGAADAVTVAVRLTTVMLTTPDHMRGRSFALMILAAQTANNVGTIWVGTWAGLIGASNTMVMGGVISIVATALIWWFWKPIREFRSGDSQAPS